jgi:hypothetical protein
MILQYDSNRIYFSWGFIKKYLFFVFIYFLYPLFIFSIFIFSFLFLFLFVNHFQNKILFTMKYD